MSNSIGLFDSGTGGLSVLKNAIKKIHNKNFVYLGDTGRMPYGVRKPEEIRDFTIEAMGFLQDKDVDLSVIACNTATVHGLKASQEKYDYPILGIISWGSLDSVEMTHNRKIALIGTESTVNSKVYDNTIKGLDPRIEVKSIACQDLVLPIERGEFDEAHMERLIRNHLEEFGDFDYDTIILGCTHFPIVKKSFKNIYKKDNRNVRIINPAYLSIKKTMEILDIEDDNEPLDERTIDFYLTGDIDMFKHTLDQYLDLSEFKVSFNQVDTKDLNKYLK